MEKNPKTPPRRRDEHPEERHEARVRRVETEAEEDKERGEGEGDSDEENPLEETVEVTRVGGKRAPLYGKRGPPRITPRTCTPIVAGSPWRLPASQRRVAHGPGNH